MHLDRSRRSRPRPPRGGPEGRTGTLVPERAPSAGPPCLRAGNAGGASLRARATALRVLAARCLIGWTALLLAAAVAAHPNHERRAASALYKCLTYNTAWEDRPVISVLVLALRDEEAATAGLFVDLLGDVARETGGRKLIARPAVWSRLDPDSLAADPPMAVFAVGRGAPPPGSIDEELRTFAELHSVLIASESPDLTAASIRLGISDDVATEIWVDMERSRRQGARFSFSFLRFLHERGS